MPLDRFAMNVIQWVVINTTGRHDFVSFARLVRGRTIGRSLDGIENDVEEDWLSKLEREVEEADHLGRMQLLLVVQ